MNYRDIIEILYIYLNPNMKHKIIKGLNTPIEECLTEDEVEW